MIKPFAYIAFPQRVVFGVGAIADIGREVAALRIDRALVMSTPGQAANSDRVKAELGRAAVGLFDQAAMHVPVETVDKALQAVRSLRVDGVVVVGGGSALGLAKMVALSTSLPVVAVPTTYAGSEMTSIYGFTEKGAKKTGRDSKVLPKTVLYDPDLTCTLPLGVSSASGMNAIAHSVEALYAVDTNPMVCLMAEEGVRALRTALPLLGPADSAARSDALYGAWLSGAAFASVSMGLHHKLCHVLGGTFALPHAETHSIVLPYAARYNERAAPEAMARLARALDANDAPLALFQLTEKLGIRKTLADLGVKLDDLRKIAALVTDIRYPNPAPIEQPRVMKLLELAFYGERP